MWKAAGDAIDIYAADIYAQNFAEWCERYERAGNPLFIPETFGGAGGQANVLYLRHRSASGHRFSPFAMDSFVEPERELLTDESNSVGNSHKVLTQIAPIILQHQGRGEMAGFLLDKDHPRTTEELKGYRLDVSIDQIFETEAKTGYGLVIAVGPDEFLGAGSGFRVSFRPKDGQSARLGIASIDEGTFSDGVWIPGRRLNGDENDQGRFWRFAPHRINIEKASLYRYE